MLVPVGYCEEWYVQELKEALKKKYGSSLVQEQPVGGAGGAPGVASLIAQFVAETNIPADYLLHLFENLTTHRAELSHTLTLCNTLHLPLHPQFTHYWNAIPAEQLLHLLRWLQKGRMQYGVQDSVDKKIPSSASFLSLEKKLRMVFFYQRCLAHHTASFLSEANARGEEAVQQEWHSNSG